MFQPDREQLAWAAGFFDGEGHTGSGSYKNGQGKRTRSLYVAVHQTDRKVLDRFHSAVGGVGSVMGPYEKPGNRQSVWHYQARGFPQTVAVIAMLWPFLDSVKRAQAAAAIARYQAYPCRTWRRRPTVESVGGDEIVRRYLAGESMSALERATDVERKSIRRHLRAAGVSIR